MSWKCRENKNLVSFICFSSIPGYKFFGFSWGKSKDLITKKNCEP